MELNTSPAAVERKIAIANIISKIIDITRNTIQTNIKMNNGDIIQLVVFVMELIEKQPLNLSGEEKIYICKSVCEKCIDFIPNFNQKDREQTLTLIPNIAEIITQAAKGRFSFGTKIKSENLVKIDTMAISSQLYDRLKTFIIEKNYTPENITKNIFILLAQMMSIVDEYPYLNGDEKKAIVISTTQKIENDLFLIFPDMTDNEKILLKTALQMVPSLIDTIVNAARGYVFINQIKGGETTSCFKKVFKCC